MNIKSLIFGVLLSSLAGLMSPSHVAAQVRVGSGGNMGDIPVTYNANSKNPAIHVPNISTVRDIVVQYPGNPTDCQVTTYFVGGPFSSAAEAKADAIKRNDFSGPVVKGVGLPFVDKEPGFYWIWTYGQFGGFALIEKKMNRAQALEFRRVPVLGLEKGMSYTYGVDDESLSGAAWGSGVAKVICLLPGDYKIFFTDKEHRSSPLQKFHVD